jgi:hypothetical protein
MRNIGKYKLTECEVEYYKKHPDFLSDGRHVGRIGEEWVAELIDGIRQPENSSFDVLANKSKYYEKNIRLEVRSAIKNVSFASSKEVGSGRTVTEEGFVKKLESLDVFIIIDSRRILEGFVTIIELTKDDILGFNLGKNKSMKASKFWKKIDTWK